MNKQGFYLADSIDVIEEVLASGGEFRLYPRGTSMLPLIVQGEDSVLLRRKSGGLQKKDIAFYRRDDGQFVLHRVIKKSRDQIYTMCGDNQTVLEKGIREDQIIGYAAGVYKKDTLVNINSHSHRVYLFFWCCMPLRRIIKFPRKLLSKIKRIFVKIFSKKG